VTTRQLIIMGWVLFWAITGVYAITLKINWGLAPQILALCAFQIYLGLRAFDFYWETMDEIRNEEDHKVSESG